MAEKDSVRIVQFTLAGAVGGVVSAVAVSLVLVALARGGGIHLPQGTGGTSSPIKVRGGAMTIRAKNWSTDSAHKDAAGMNAACVAADPTYLKFVDVVSVKTPDATPGPQTLTITGSWQMDLYGRTPLGVPQEADGVRVFSTTNCGPNNDQPGVSFVGEPGTKSTFYPYLDEILNVKDEDKKTAIRRFMDPTCAPSQGAVGDEDLCEHMSNIYINYTPTNTPNVKPDISYLCQNGECRLEIGK